MTILISLLLALQSPFLTLNHLMSSQTGNLQNLAACSGHPSPFIIRSEVEPDNLSRQEFAQRSPLPHDIGLRFMTIPVSEDAQYVYFVSCCCAPLDPLLGTYTSFHSFLNVLRMQGLSCWVWANLKLLHRACDYVIVPFLVLQSLSFGSLADRLA